MATSESAPKVVVLISTRLRPGCDIAAYQELEARMDQVVREIPGYLGAKGFTAEDGETVALVLFESTEALRRWRDHPEHLETQRRGRDEFYAYYQIRVCSVEREYDFDVQRNPARAERP